MNIPITNRAKCLPPWPLRHSGFQSFHSLYAPFLKERPLILQLCEFLYLRDLICSDVADASHTVWQPASLGPHLLVHSDRNLQIEISWEKVAGRSQKQKIEFEFTFIK